MFSDLMHPLDLNGFEIRNALLHKLAAAPGSPVAGQTYYNTAQNRAYIYNGTAWVLMSALTGAEILALLAPVDGAGSGLDADLLDGQQGTHYLARGNHSGTQLASTISNFDTQVRTSRLDQMAAPTAAVSLNNQRITNLDTPVSAFDAATKQYVDGVAVGLDFKESVLFATAVNDTLSGLGLRAGPEVAPTDGARVLVKAQTNAAQNGIYIASAGAWNRAPDAMQGRLTRGAFVWVEDGLEGGGTAWVLSTFDGNVVTDPQTWTQFSGANETTAGNGLYSAGSTFHVGAGPGIVANPNNVAIDTAVVARKAAFNVGNGSLLQFDLAHNLGTRDVQVSVVRNASPWNHVGVRVESLDVNTVRLVFGSAPAANAYRALVVG